MIAIDTNILVRLLTGDDLGQLDKAQALVDGAEVWVSSTVLLETSWVLRSTYGFDAAVVLDRLRAVAGLPNVRLQDARAIRQALDWAAAGLGFADALHLAQAQACEAFVSFDRRLGRRAAALAVVPPVREP